VTELRFNRAIYRGEAVDAALKAFSGFAAFEQAVDEDTQHWVVRVHVEPAERERQVAGELGNYALGLTLRQRGQR
jgi:hypothetical protein